ALTRLGRLDEAEAPLRHVLTVKPNHFDAGYRLVRLLIDQDRLTEAVTLLTAMIEQAPDRVSDLAFLVAELASRGVKESVSMLQSIVKQVPQDIIASFQLGDALVAAGERTAAAVHFK